MLPLGSESMVCFGAMPMCLQAFQEAMKCLYSENKIISFEIQNKKNNCKISHNFSVTLSTSQLQLNYKTVYITSNVECGSI